MSPRWRWFIIGYVWSLPVALAGLFMALVVYRCTSYKWIEGVLTCVSPGPMWGHPNGQTLGWVSMYSSETERSSRTMRGHEYTHVGQTFIWGILWPVLYGADFFFLWAISGFKAWQLAYEKIAFERAAYAVQACLAADKTLVTWGSRG